MTVLLADEIKRLCDEEQMIQPFRPSQLRPASYQLTLGDEIHVGGEQRLLSRTQGIILEPHQVAVVSTLETLKIPRDLIARWSLRVTNIYEGLLWTGGPQVDPGWEGQLFCPIYNLSERPFVLKYGDGLFTMDFVRTTPVGPSLEELRKDKSYKKIWFEPVRKTLAEHDSHRLRSAPYEALRELRELRYFRSFGYIAVSLIMLVLTFMVAALAVVAATPNVKMNISLTDAWLWFIIGAVAFFSVASIGVSSFVLYRLRKLL